MGPLLVLAVLLGLLSLPLAVWLDLRSLSERLLRLQASETSRIIDDMRGFYATDVVGRVLAAHGEVTTSHEYRTIPGAIPIPATLSIELGKLISNHDGTVKYRFVSDLPFKGREPHRLDGFELGAIDTLRQNPDQPVVEVAGSILDRTVRVATPVVMKEVCVSCHNTHPDSPKTDWKVGDVRGIQEVSIVQPFADNILAFKWLIGYFVLLAMTGAGFIVLERRQAMKIDGMNKELAGANEFLATLSMKISRYLSPQIYKSIFSGQRDVVIETERKKLTIFFSDIKDFTATTERLQPEQITRLLNEYFTEMSAIALKHGGTIDKFVGDAILIFFGDPESKGEAEDARACVRMALDMQKRIAELSVKWRNEGIEHPFRARMGVNTGYCNVGNFGSADRMDYTIIGAEANLAARLQAVAEAGRIVISYETYALVRTMVEAHALSPITMKGISREVVPYVVEGLLDASGRKSTIINEHTAGLDIYIDPTMVDERSAERAQHLLLHALDTLHKRTGKA